ncbi:MAG: TetR family transcriptional regulator C-terminal domain-containing protein [Oscillospiraceae bacterium]|nr:TetR family transcriptional regulator C-terminal domain-containing protein [Oscillospiraceae bacterium]
MRALCTEIFEHIFSDELSREATHDFSGREKDVEGEITHILYHLNDSRPYIKSILSCEGGEMFMRYFKEYLSSLFAGELMKHKSEVPISSFSSGSHRY